MILNDLKMSFKLLKSPDGNITISFEASCLSRLHCIWDCSRSANIAV